MHRIATSTPASWLAFELSILNRIDFSSVAFPLMGDPAIGHYLKRRRVRVTSNDILQTDWNRSLYSIQNNTESLSEQDIDDLLLDVYVPGNKLKASVLLNWFSETDSWWFDNLRGNIARLESPLKRAAAVSIAVMVGNYVHSFTEETREFRQPLSGVFRRLCSTLPKPINNHQDNACLQKTPDDFIAESTVDLMFLRLPHPEARSHFKDRKLWREEWLRGGSEFWREFESGLSGRLGTPSETKSQYLKTVDQFLSRAGHIKHWAFGHVETGFLLAQEIAETIGKHRKVEAIYTKDFSELSGKKAVIITA